jgi:uncharacterized protein DUF4365
MSAKTVPNSVFIGNEGAYLVPQIVNEMRFLWTPSGQFELGIDGTIEIVDPATAKGTGNIIKAQIKTTSQTVARGKRVGVRFRSPRNGFELLGTGRRNVDQYRCAWRLTACCARPHAVVIESRSII